MFDNIKAHLKPHGDGKGGTYFGATGCGKTYTMLFLARMLNQRARDIFNNPTIIIITDREELDRQISELFVSSKKYLHDENVRSMESRKLLQQAMEIQKYYDKCTLIQTISRVNRVFDGKDMGLAVDYIGIKQDMLEAVKKYGSPQDSPIDEIAFAIAIFSNHLALLDELLHDFDASWFFYGEPIERLICLDAAAEYVQISKEMESRFMNLSRKLKAAYDICYPSGELTDGETSKAQFYLAIRSIIYKQTKGDAPDAAVMNRYVEKMVQDAISCSGI